MTEQLNICSALGRRYLYEMDWLDSLEKIENELSRVEYLCGIRSQPAGKALCERLACRLMQTRDIRGTLRHLGEGCVLDDLELFELKNFALLAQEVREMTQAWTFVRVPDLRKVIVLLDPEGTRVPHFYIYDVYSEELADLRKLIKQRKQRGEDEQETEKIYFQCVEIEDRIRGDLSEKLRAFAGMLQQALDEVAGMDVLLAKARQACEMQLVRPGLTAEAEEGMVLKGLFNPQLRELLTREGKNFQPVDIGLSAGATVITGANMAGKTVLLKSVALAQYLMQFGFFVPAYSARMVMVDEIEMSVGDEQDELSGLSSFAAEMLRINAIVGRVKAGRKVLVLIDELARTTNPAEGQAIVNGVVEFLTAHQTMALVTTHYSGIVAQCRKLRVRGFVEGRIKGDVTLKNINDFIDYSLQEDSSAEVPHEAIRIAWMLGVDEELLQTTGEFLSGER